MVTEVQNNQREEVVPEDSGRLTPSRLDRSAITEKGGQVMDGKATLICIPELGTEGEKLFKVQIADDLIVPNPNQPREYFDPAEMDDLKKTIKKAGQEQPIIVVPILLEDGSRKLFIVDGERRFRAIKELKLSSIKIIVAWASNEKKVLYKSLRANISRAGHNPIDIAKAFKRAIALEKKEAEPLSMEEIAEEIGFALNTLYKYLEYLEHLTPELQEMMQKGTLGVSAADGIVKKAKEYGAKLDLGVVAKEVKTTRGLTEAVVNMAVGKGLKATGHGADAVRNEVRSAISKLDSSLVSGCNAADVVLEADPAIVLECFFERADSSRPPEVMRDKIGNLHRRLARMLEIIDQAIEPPALTKVPGKPDFLKYIGKKANSFGHHVRFEIAKVLAQVVDEHGKFMTGAELIKASGIKAQDFSTVIRLLKMELPKTGIELQVCDLRRKDGRGIYQKVFAYRLAWLTEEKKAADVIEPDVTTVDDGCPKRMIDAQRLGAIKAAHARVEARQKEGGSSVQIKDLEIVCKVPNGDPDLFNAAGEIAKNIQLIGYDYTVRGGTEFGQRLGVKIEVFSRGGQKIFIIKSNVRGFALNFKLSTNLFADFISTALRLAGGVTVDVQDL